MVYAYVVSYSCAGRAVTSLETDIYLELKDMGQRYNIMQYEPK